MGQGCVEIAAAVSARSRPFYGGYVPRSPRDEQPNSYYHVVTRGSNGGSIVFDDDDRKWFLWRLGEAVVRHRWVLYSYCLMTTHFHLVLRNPYGGVSAGMQRLNGGHSRYVSARYERFAHLFENRFGGRQIEDEDHFFRACRYVELNPVRAAACSHPAEYRWSSYGANVGLAFAEVRLATDELLGHFASDPVAGRAAYARYVAEGLDSVSDTDTEV